MIFIVSRMSVSMFESKQTANTLSNYIDKFRIHSCGCEKVRSDIRGKKYRITILEKINFFYPVGILRFFLIIFFYSNGNSWENKNFNQTWPICFLNYYRVNFTVHPQPLDKVVNLTPTFFLVANPYPTFH